MTTGARSVELEDPDPAQLTRDEIAALVSEAHRQGYRTAAHCEGLAGTELAITEGIDTIEHGMYLHQRPDLLEQMAANDQTLVPTLSCFYGVAGREHAIGLDSGDVRSAPRAPPAYLPRAGRAAPCWSPLLVDLANHNLRQADLTLRAARSAGVRIAAGHDWHPVWDHALEIRRLIAHGLTAGEALSAATRCAAAGIGNRRSRRHGSKRQARRPRGPRGRPARRPRAAQRPLPDLAGAPVRSPGRRCRA